MGWWGIHRGGGRLFFVVARRGVEMGRFEVAVSLRGVMRTGVEIAFVICLLL
jgi:hypothetical protein